MRKLALAFAIVSAGIAAVPINAAVAGPQPAPSFEASIAAATAAMQFKPQEAVRLAQQAALLAQQAPAMPNRSVAIATANWLEGEAAMRLNRSDIGGPLIHRALAIASRDAPSSKLHGDLLLSLSRLQSQRGHPEEALVASQNAYAIFIKLKSRRSQAVALQSIGSIYQYAADFEKALYYYDLADQAVPDDLSLRLTSSNNRANSFRELGRINEAVREDMRALSIAKKLNSPVLISRVLGNLATAQIAANDLTGAHHSIETGLKISSQPGNGGWHADLLVTSVVLALQESRFKQAMALAKLAFMEISDQQHSQSYRTLQNAAYRIYKALGDDRTALMHLEIFTGLDNQSRSLTASISAKLISARFDFANQNARIAMLQSGQLKRDVQLARLKTRQQAILLSALLGVATFAILFLFIIIRSIRISRNKLQTSNAALQTANENLEKALAAKSLFLATTSHEIRTPLNGVLGMAQIILADTEIKGGLRERIHLIENAGNTMKALVDDILDLAKMDSGKYEIVMKPFNVTLLLEEVVDFWKAQAETKHLKIILCVEELPELIEGDLNRLRQVFYNLVSNAIKFTLAGEIRVYAKIISNILTETLKVDIIDSGIGIAEKYFETIFDKFYQLDQGTTRQFGGSGLGLAISRHIMQALGGDISVMSVIGKGSVFSVDLPFRRVEQAIDIRKIKKLERADSLATCRVAVAGANPIPASVLCALLRSHAFSVTVVYDLNDLKNQIEDNNFDLVLIDGDALHACEHFSIEQITNIKTALVARQIPSFMLLTPPVALGNEISAFDIFLRPISAETLVARLAAVFMLKNEQYYDNSYRSATG